MSDRAWLLSALAVVVLVAAACAAIGWHLGGMWGAVGGATWAVVLLYGLTEWP